ncbi:hypothetical protein [Robertkochia aurantiaca]|uniref:hypothetical protein n=1 Tax=Robertkochia aurantiaca TaxID=2873700 RepID=UPI001CCD09DD|nr:hypothetical protein [Robertkochia sp. 3YJGBD-33]
MSERNLIIITKIIGIYCLFYAGVKAYAAISTRMWTPSNLVIAGLLALVAGVSFYIIRQQKYSWFFVIFGILFVTLLRAFERDLVQWLHGIL